jgi:hypothetical protein
MVFSSFSAVFLSLVALSASRPVSDSADFQISPEQLDFLFRTGVESALQNTSPPEISRIVETDFASQACEDISIIFARGTFEPGGESFMGTLVGPPFVKATKSAVPGKNILAIGVDYNNGVGGYLSGGDAAGSTKMAKMINDKATNCPAAKIVVSGYRYKKSLSNR